MTSWQSMQFLCVLSLRSHLGWVITVYLIVNFGVNEEESNLPTYGYPILLCSKSNLTITEKTIFNSAIYIQLWKWFGSRGKNPNFSCSSCNSILKSLKYIVIARLWIFWWGEESNPKLIIYVHGEESTLIFGVKTGNLASLMCLMPSTTSFASANCKKIKK